MSEWFKSGKVGPSGGEKAASSMQLEGPDKVKVAAYIDRVEAMVGRTYAPEYEQELASLKAEFGTLSKEDQAAMKLAIANVADRWEPGLNPGLEPLTKNPRERSQALRAWAESL